MKLLCRVALLCEGVPMVSLQKWFEAVYLNPDLSVVEATLNEHIAKITDGDMMDLLSTYGEEGSSVALRKMMGYFSKLYGVQRKLPIIEDREIETLACFARFNGMTVEGLSIAINPETYFLLDGAALMIVLAHEVWHAWQIQQMEKWLKKLCGARIDFNVSPEVAEREMLYYLNFRYRVSPGRSVECYGQQLIEREAYCASDIMQTRIALFSEPLLERAIRSFDSVPMKYE